MIVEKIGKHFKYIRENWKEYFQIYVTGVLIKSKREGDMIPRFYLPIWKTYDRYYVECWIFPLAPFVLFWRILQQVTKIIWSDLIEWLIMLYEWNKKS
jgi:hypothetical protein